MEDALSKIKEKVREELESMGELDAGDFEEDFDEAVMDLLRSDSNFLVGVNNNTKKKNEVIDRLVKEIA